MLYHTLYVLCTDITYYITNNGNRNIHVHYAVLCFLVKHSLFCDVE